MPHPPLPYRPQVSCSPTTGPSRRGLILGGAALALLPRRGAAQGTQTAGAQGMRDWAAQPWQVMMVGSPACQHCRAWHAEIGPGYGASRAGRAAPLFHVDLQGPYPDGLALDRRPWITPTFVLLRRGVETGRVEGYVGARHFHPVLEDVMRASGLALPG